MKLQFFIVIVIFDIGYCLGERNNEDNSKVEDMFHNLMVHVGKMTEMCASQKAADDLKEHIIKQEVEMGILKSRIQQLEIQIRGDCDKAAALDAIAETNQHVLQNKLAINSLTEDVGNINNKLDAVISHLEQQSTQLGQLKPTYPATSGRVVHFSSPSGSYKLTYESAKSLCESKGFKMATKQQLQTALDLGMEVCACGWMKDRSIHYPHIWPHNGCGGENTPRGLRTCSQTLSDVYCYTY